MFDSTRAQLLPSSAYWNVATESRSRAAFPVVTRRLRGHFLETMEQYNCGCFARYRWTRKFRRVHPQHAFATDEFAAVVRQPSRNHNGQRAEFAITAPVKIWPFALDDELLAVGWLHRPDGGYVPLDQIRLATPSAFVGEHDPPGAIAFVRRPIGSFRRYDRLSILGFNKSGDVQTKTAVLPRSALRVALPRTRPNSIPKDAKWVHVSLQQQVLTAYEGDRLVFATLVSTGRTDQPTSRGLFRVFEKVIHASMHGVLPSPYFVDEVPFILYVYNSVGLHGTFWHDRFGERMSHGCINLSIADAEWLFTWAPPQLPAGWHAVEPEAANRPTLWVLIEN